MKNIDTLFDDPETTVFIGCKDNIKEMIYSFFNSYKNGREIIGNRILRNPELENILMVLIRERETPYITHEDLKQALYTKIKKQLNENDLEEDKEEDDFEIINM